MGDDGLLGEGKVLERVWLENLLGLCSASISVVSESCSGQAGRRWAGWRRTESVELDGSQDDGGGEHVVKVVGLHNGRAHEQEAHGDPDAIAVLWGEERVGHGQDG